MKTVLKLRPNIIDLLGINPFFIQQHFATDLRAALEFVNDLVGLQKNHFHPDSNALSQITRENLDQYHRVNEAAKIIRVGYSLAHLEKDLANSLKALNIPTELSDELCSLGHQQRELQLKQEKNDKTLVKIFSNFVRNPDSKLVVKPGTKMFFNNQWALVFDEDSKASLKAIKIQSSRKIKTFCVRRDGKNIPAPNIMHLSKTPEREFKAVIIDEDYSGADIDDLEIIGSFEYNDCEAKPGLLRLETDLRSRSGLTQLSVEQFASKLDNFNPEVDLQSRAANLVCKYTNDNGEIELCILYNLNKIIVPKGVDAGE